MPVDLLVEHDPSTGATYCSFSDASAAATQHVSDLVLVDLDADGNVVGIEFAGGIDALSDDEWRLLAEVAPSEMDQLRTLS